MNDNNNLTDAIDCDVLLINPPVSKMEMPEDKIVVDYFEAISNIGKLLGDSDIEPNYGILSIAANCRKHIKDLDIKILDLNIIDQKLRISTGKAITIDEIKKQLNKYNPLISGISFMTSSYGVWGKELIKLTKKRSEYLFLGGIHPTVRFNEVYQHNKDYIDGIVVGEGEQVFVEIVKKILAERDYSGISHLYTGSEKVVSRAVLSNIDLSDLPIPAYDLMYEKDEEITPRFYTSRGCNFDCTMCSVGEFYKKRKFNGTVPINTDKVLEDIKETSDNYTIGHYIVGDLCVYENSKMFMNFLLDLNRLQTKNSIQKKNWWCQTRGDVITETLAKQLKETGFSQVAIGCEGATQGQLDSISKGENIDKIEKALLLMQKYDIDTQCYWILGLPGETKESIKATQDKILEYLEQGLTTIPHITILVPYPNTKVAKDPGIKVLHHDYSKYWMNCDLHGYGKPVYNTVNPRSQKIELSADYIYKFWLETLQKVTEYLRSE